MVEYNVAAWAFQGLTALEEPPNSDAPSVQAEIGGPSATIFCSPQNFSLRLISLPLQFSGSQN